MNFEVIEHGENVRHLKFLNKEVSIERTDPHGLWEFTWSGGDPPEKLQGKFTTPTMAYEFLNNYIQSLEKKKK